VLTATAGVLSAVLLVVAVVLAQDGRAPTGPAATAAPPAANHVLRINPTTLQEEQAVAVGTDPGAVVVGGGLVWVANRRDGTVTVVDPDSNRVQQSMRASGSGPIGERGPGLAFAGGSLWVANFTERGVARVEPGADPVPVPVGGARTPSSPPRTPCGWRSAPRAGAAGWPASTPAPTRP
jgi:DNA-binding beta-propeller fold protein YncE